MRVHGGELIYSRRQSLIIGEDELLRETNEHWDISKKKTAGQYPVHYVHAHHTLSNPVRCTPMPKIRMKK